MNRFLLLNRSSRLVRLQRSFHTTSPRLSKQVEVFVDGKPVQVPAGTAVIQACEAAGAEIPRFCYHERLAVAGNCRMCLVELEKAPKPIASCAMPVAPGMNIKTNTPLVKKAREGVMEFLLANHPLDCPICDQGGECDLQDQSVRYGSDRSRFSEPAGKRAVENKNLGPIVKTVMTRCIQCTRCVRFANDVAGADELGTTGRGNDMQIGTYVEKLMSSEMSGNIVDLCPVGALTSKPYSFKARPWELKKTESIDVMDAIGSNIRVDSRGVEVMRVLPRLNDDINEEWISDKTRHACDGLKRQRLTTPLIREGDKFVPASWPQALSKIAEAIQNVKGEEMVGIAGQLADAESLVALKDFFNAKNSENLRLETTAESAAHRTDIRSNYVLNSGIAGVEKADAILLIGTNPRHEAAILNTRIRKSFVSYTTEIGLIGEQPKLNYEYSYLGDSLSGIDTLLSKSSNEFVAKLKSAKRPLLLVGSSILERKDAAGCLSGIAKLASSLKKTAEPGWEPLNVLHRAASWTAALDIGYDARPRSNTPPKFVYLLNADEVSGSDIPQDSFVVYQGHHGDQGAYFADVILPGAAYTEKQATYVNTEGRAQTTRAAVAPPAGAREDWKIIRALSEVAGEPLPYDTIAELRDRLYDVCPSLVHYEEVDKTSKAVADLGLSQLASSTTSISAVPLGLPIKDFYLTDPISRSSKTMAQCSSAFTKGETYVDQAALC